MGFLGNGPSPADVDRIGDWYLRKFQVSVIISGQNNKFSEDQALCVCRSTDLSERVRRRERAAAESWRISWILIRIALISSECKYQKDGNCILVTIDRRMIVLMLYKFRERVTQRARERRHIEFADFCQ